MTSFKPPFCKPRINLTIIVVVSVIIVVGIVFWCFSADFVAGTCGSVISEGVGNNCIVLLMMLTKNLTCIYALSFLLEVLVSC